MNILLTGSTGFLGGRLTEVLINEVNINLTCVTRKQINESIGYNLMVKPLGPKVDWTSLLSGQDVLVHVAALTHSSKSKISNPLEEYRRINVDSTLNLARQAAEAGVKRFVFISSIGVNGISNKEPFTEKDTPLPFGLYAQSKWEAEQGLWKLHHQKGIELVIIRPPLVYGPRARGSFARLLSLIEKEVPLPLGDIRNQRSLVALDNLVDLIMTCIDHPAAANQVFLASDGKDVSTTDLILGVAEAMGKPARLVKVPASILMVLGVLLGKKTLAQRLLGSLQIDISKAREVLGWEPPISVEEGFRRCFAKD